jgi:hypothetical protein
MEQCRNHYFPANDCTVVTGLCPNGQFGAYREQDDGRVRGYGHNRYAAIADLVEAISHTEEDEETNRADYAVDHALDYRKHEAV